MELKGFILPLKRGVCLSVWKSQKNDKNGQFGKFLKNWSMRSYCVTRQVNFNWTKMVKNAKILKIQMRHFALGEFRTICCGNWWYYVFTGLALFRKIFRSCFSIGWWYVGIVYPISHRVYPNSSGQKRELKLHFCHRQMHLSSTATPTTGKNYQKDLVALRATTALLRKSR